ALKEHFQDYKGYCDSKSQLPLASATMPYLFYGKVVSSQLQAKIAEETKRFFQELFSTQEALHNNEALQQAIVFVLYTKNDELLQLLGEYASNSRVRIKTVLPYLSWIFSLMPRATHKDAFDALLATNRYYLHQLDQGIIAFDALEQGAAINAINKEGQSALHLATLKADKKSVCTLIARGINENIQDKYGNTALIYALKNNNEVGRDIAKKLIAAQAQVDIKNNDENTPLIIAVQNKDLAMVNYLLEHGACLETFDSHMKTPLFWAAENGDEVIFDTLLKHGAQVNIASYPGEDTPLLAALNNNHLGIAQKILSQKEVVITQKNKCGETALHLAADNPEILKTILALYPENQCLEAVMIQNKFGATVLHNAVYNPESLKTILKLLPENQRLQAVMIQEVFGYSVLHGAAAMHSESLKAILALLPENQRLEAVMFKNEDGNTVLHEAAARNSESLKTILELYPENQRLEVVMIKNAYGNTVLHEAAARNSESLKTILELLPENQRLDAMMIQDNYGNTVLHKAANNAESLKTILALYPENQRLEAVRVKNKYGTTVLYLANAESLKIIRALLTTETDCNSENKEQAVLPSNQDILRIPQNRPSFFLIAKENNSDKDVRHNPAPM
ncbi:ankyrin repeat domain-containing protein, partial [Legionella santicrucis]